MKTTLIVSSGQYETCAIIVTVNHKTWGGLCRRITQLEKEHATFGDNFAGWIKAEVALADDEDEWGDNQIIGGKWCKPANGWLTEDHELYRGYSPCMTYQQLYKKIYNK